MNFFRFFGFRAYQDARLEIIHTLLVRLNKMSTELQAKIDKLATDVASLQTVDASAVALLQGLSSQLKEALAAAKDAGATAEQLAALDALDSSLTTSTDSLASAVSANTTPAA